MGHRIIDYLSDRFSRRRVFMISTVGSASAAAMLGFCTAFGPALVAQIISGLSGGTMEFAIAYISDVTTLEERTDAMGKIPSLISLGVVFAPAMSGVLYSVGGIQLAMFGAAGVSVLSLIMV